MCTEYIVTGAVYEQTVDCPLNRLLSAPTPTRNSTAKNSNSGKTTTDTETDIAVDISCTIVSSTLGGDRETGGSLRRVDYVSKIVTDTIFSISSFYLLCNLPLL